MIKSILSGCVVLLASVGVWTQSSAFYQWFPTDIKLTEAAADNVTNRAADLVILESGQILVIFSDTRMGTPQLRTMISDDNGFTFSPSIPLDNECQTSDCITQNARAAYSQQLNLIGVVYERQTAMPLAFNIYFVASLDGGLSWSLPVRVNDDQEGFDHEQPSLAIGPDHTLHVVWTDHRLGNSDVFYARSLNLGATFLPNLKINPWSVPAAADQNARISVAAAGRVLITYSSTVTGSSLVYFAASSDSGQSFDYNVAVHNAGVTQSSADLAFSAWDQAIHIAWIATNLDHATVFCSTSRDFGITFDPPVLVSHNPLGVCANPQLTVNHYGDIFVIWHDNRTASNDVYFAHSFNGGGFFFPEVQVNTDAQPTDEQQHPMLVTHPVRHFLNLVWTDFREELVASDLYGNLHRPLFFDGFTDQNFADWSFARAAVQSSDLFIDLDGYCCQLGNYDREEGELVQSYPGLQQGDLDAWFYDGYGSDPIYESTDFRVEMRAPSTQSKTGIVRAIGIVNANNSHHYQTYNGSAWTIIPDFQRSLGWHRIRIEVSDDGLTFYLDALEHPISQPVYLTTGFTAFDAIAFIGGSGEGPYYLDNVTINAAPLEPITVPALSLAGCILLSFLSLWVMRRVRR